LLPQGGAQGRRSSCTYWDNGAVYQARQVSLIAARLGIQVIFATPYAPEGKGKVADLPHNQGAVLPGGPPRRG
jgi:transposase InsO family protein